MITDKAWGDYLTAFAPIKDSGKVVGLVGVDFSSEHIRKIVCNVSYVTYFFLFILIVLSYISIHNLFKMHYLSLNTDFMTGLINRRGFAETISCAIDEAKRSGNSFALVILDIDDFKNINDRCGHQHGDEIENAAKINVAMQVEQLKNLEPVLTKSTKDNSTMVVGAVYDLKTGKVEFLPENYLSNLKS